MKWIKVTERLPDIGVRVLLLTLSAHYFFGHRGGGKVACEDYCYFDDYGEEIDIVACWMPLPPPPKSI